MPFTDRSDITTKEACGHSVRISPQGLEDAIDCYASMVVKLGILPKIAIGNQPYRPPPPMQIECTAAGFEAPATTIKPAQGLVFLCRVPSRLHLELREPDDGPHEEAAPRGTAPAGHGSREPAREGLTDEERSVLHRIVRTFRGKREGG